MKNKIVFGLLFLLSQTLALAAPVGTADQVWRMPASGGIPKFGTVDLSKSAARTGTLPHGNGGTDVTSPGTAGNELQSNGTDWVSAARSSAKDMINVGFSAAISSNTLVLSLTQSNGSSDCTAASPCMVGFRGTTQTNGDYSQVSFTAANAITLAAADSIGVSSGTGVVYVYLVSDTTKEICASASYFDSAVLKSASALTGGADTTATTLWCTSAHTTRPIRLLGSVSLSWSNPNWGSITSVSHEANMGPSIRSEILVGTGNGHGSSNGMIRRFSTTYRSVGTDITFAQSSTAGDSFTINSPGIYAMSYQDYPNAGPAYFGISLNSSQLNTSIASITAADVVAIAYTGSVDSSNLAQTTMYLNAGDVIRAHTNSNTTSTVATLCRFRITKVAN